MKDLIQRCWNDDTFRWIILPFLGGSILIAVIVTLIGNASARDLDGKHAQSPLHNWFTTLKNKNSVPCCDGADGKSVRDVDWDTHDGKYRVRMDGKWMDVPPEAVVESPNKFGPAVVWPYQDYKDETKIRCFMPGALT